MPFVASPVCISLEAVSICHPLLCFWSSVGMCEASRGNSSSCLSSTSPTHHNCWRYLFSLAAIFYGLWPFLLFSFCRESTKMIKSVFFFSDQKECGEGRTYGIMGISISLGRLHPPPPSSWICLPINLRVLMKFSEFGLFTASPLLIFMWSLNLAASQNAPNLEDSWKHLLYGHHFLKIVVWSCVLSLVSLPLVYVCYFL